MGAGEKTDHNSCHNTSTSSETVKESGSGSRHDRLKQAKLGDI